MKPRFIALLFSVSVGLCYADSLFVEEPIAWQSTQILLVDSCVDGYKRVNYDSRFERVSISWEFAGTSDSTLLDIKKMYGDTARSILESAPLRIRAGEKGKNKVVVMNNLIDVQEGDILRMDIMSVAGGNPKNFNVTAYLRLGIPKK